MKALIDVEADFRVAFTRKFEIFLAAKWSRDSVVMPGKLYRLCCDQGSNRKYGRPTKTTSALRWIQKESLARPANEHVQVAVALAGAKHFCGVMLVVSRLIEGAGDAHQWPRWYLRRLGKIPAGRWLRHESGA